VGGKKVKSASTIRQAKENLYFPVQWKPPTSRLIAIEALE